jgi:ribose 5-phosphate isomerase A
MAATTGDPLVALATHALGFVSAGAIVGLGSGRAASAFVRALGARVREGLRVRGVATSEETAAPSCANASSRRRHGGRSFS